MNQHCFCSHYSCADGKSSFHLSVIWVCYHSCQSLFQQRRPMSRNKSSSTFNQGLKKFFLSAFVVFAFIAYAIHERLTNFNAGLSSASVAPTSVGTQDASASSSSAPTPDPS